jgi:hypothetical protein
LGVASGVISRVTVWTNCGLRGGVSSRFCCVRTGVTSAGRARLRISRIPDPSRRMKIRRLPVVLLQKVMSLRGVILKTP